MAGIRFWDVNDAGESPSEAPDYFDNPWDTFYVNGDQVPGLCDLQNKSLAALDVETSKGKNNSGATVRIFGYKPGAFDLVVTITTRSQWDLWCSFCDKYWQGPSQKRKPPASTVKVSHPDLTRVKVFEAVIVGLPLAERAENDLEKKFRVQFQERRKQEPRKAAVAKGAVIPEFAGLPSSFPENELVQLPSKDPKNLGLEGPPLKR